MMSKSTPPSMRAPVDWAYAAARSSNPMLRNPGSFTSGEIDVVLLVGPKTPATNMARFGCSFFSSSMTRDAILAPSRFSS